MDFFARLYSHYGSKLTVYYSPGNLGILTPPVAMDWAVPVGIMRRLFGQLAWQPGIAGLPILRGDVVVLSGNPRHLSTLALFFRAKLRGAKVIWWGHLWSSTSRNWRQFLRYGPMSIADALLFYTDDEVEAYKVGAIGYHDRHPIAALNNGIDITPILPLRCPYIASEREYALLFIGRLTQKSGLEIGLEALADLGSIAPTLYVIGDGVQQQKLQAHAVKLGLQEKIVWCGAMTDETKIAAIANRCRAFLYPGEVGLSLIHAMAYGLPVIVHNDRSRHMPEIAAFLDGKTGLAFAYKNPKSLVSTIVNGLADNTQLNSWSKYTNDIVGPSYTTKNMATRFIALIDKLEGME